MSDTDRVQRKQPKKTTEPSTTQTSPEEELFDQSFSAGSIFSGSHLPEANDGVDRINRMSNRDRIQTVLSLQHQIGNSATNNILHRNHIGTSNDRLGAYFPILASPSKAQAAPIQRQVHDASSSVLTLPADPFRIPRFIGLRSAPRQRPSAISRAHIQRELMVPNFTHFERNPLDFISPLAQYDIEITNMGLDSVADGVRDLKKHRQILINRINVVNSGLAEGDAPKQAIIDAKNRIRATVNGSDEIRKVVTSYVNYVKPNGAIYQAASAAKSAISAMNSSSAGLSKTIAEKAKIKAKRDADSAEKDVNKKKDEIKAWKSNIGSILDAGVDAISEGSVKKFMVSSAKFLGKKLVELGVDAAFKSELDALTQKLKDAKAQVQSLEDYAATQAVHQAASMLQSKIQSVSEKLAALSDAIDKAEQSETTMITKFQAVGLTEVVHHIRSRKVVIANHNALLADLPSYQDEVKTLKDNATPVMNENWKIGYGMSQYINNNFDPQGINQHESEKAALAASRNNAPQLKSLVQGSNNEINSVVKLQSQLRNTEFESFDGMITELNNILRGADAGAVEEYN